MPHTVPYRVVFSPEAWKKVGNMAFGDFQALQGGLEGIASRMGASRPLGEDASSQMHTDVSGLTIVYLRDDETHTLTVVDIRPAASRAR